MTGFLPSRPWLLGCGAFVCGISSAFSTEVEPFGKGPHAAGSTNLEVADQYAGVGDEAMGEYLSGRAEPSRFVTDILKYPESAWIVEVPVPAEPALYGPASGRALPVAAFLTYPARESERPNGYAFPYHHSQYGVFEDMLGPGETPEFADPTKRYPLIILSHGATAHGIYDVRHAHALASHGYIVVVIFYGDNRIESKDGDHHHSFLRPLLTKAVLDSVLDSEEFGPRVDPDNIGISGHSLGGFTALALAGGLFQGNPETVGDDRIKAGVIAAPWVGGHYDGSNFFAFGPGNRELNRVTAPMLCLFGTKDQDTLASFILPAMRQLSGPTFVVELVDQPHVFEQGSWEDRDNWELLFFSAYLKKDPAALRLLESARSMKGGNEDVQLFDYQRSTGHTVP